MTHTHARSTNLLLLLLVLLPLACSSGGGGSPVAAGPRGVLVGLVATSGSGAPIAAATVTLAEPRLTATTGPDGRFRLADVPTGQRMLSVAAAGFQQRTQPVTVGDNTTVTADFALVVIAAGGRAQVTFVAADRLWRIEATAGALPEDLTARLDAIAPLPGRHQGPITVSPDGSWYVFRSERFEPGSQGNAGLCIAPSDFSRAETVVVNGTTIHGDGMGQAVAGGLAIVYVDGGGPHTRDLFVVRRAGNTWTGPFLLTAASPYAFHDLPVLTADNSRVVFQAGPQPYGAAGTRLCEVMLDGNGFQTLLEASAVPPGFGPSPALRVPAPAPDGSIVFEAEWTGGEQVWRLPANRGNAVLIAARFVNDNSPTVLPDGRIASLWLEAPGASGLHQLKVMDPDGSNELLLTLGASFTEVSDVGMGAGPLL